MKEVIGAYRQVTATDEFRELERLHSRARHNEAAALRHARDMGAEAEREKWQGVVADLQGSVANKDAILAEKDAENAHLRIQLAALQARLGEN